jgi:CubicO group peptidase (beta-lactamase class C family)
MHDLTHRIDLVLDAAISAGRVVGAIALVARRGELVYHRALGLADREAGRAMAEDTPHRLASLTKPVTIAAALALIDRGALGLEQPVTRWLPDFQPRFGAGAPVITLHQLMTHTSGLGYTFNEPPGGPYHQAMVSDGLEQPGLALAENLRRLASVPLRSAPGTAFTYSLSIDVLGAILERAADAPLPEVIARHVTGPLELPELVFTPRSPAEAAALAVPYADGAPPVRVRADQPVPFFPPLAVSFAPDRALDPASYPSGGAGMVGSARPFLGFLEAVRARRIPGVPAALLDLMFSDQIPGLVPETLEPGWGFSYGAAILRDPAPTGTALRRGAIRWGGAYGHSWAIDPSTETTHLLLTNTMFEGMNGPLSQEIQRAVHA